MMGKYYRQVTQTLAKKTPVWLRQSTDRRPKNQKPHGRTLPKPKIVQAALIVVVPEVEMLEAEFDLVMIQTGYTYKNSFRAQNADTT